MFPTCSVVFVKDCLLFTAKVSDSTDTSFISPRFWYSPIQTERGNYVERPLEEEIHMHMFDFRHSAYRIMESIPRTIKQVLETKPEWLITAITGTIFREFCYITAVIMSTTESDYLTVAIWRGFLFHSVMKCYVRVWCRMLINKREMPNESRLYYYQNPIHLLSGSPCLHISWECCTHFCICT